MLTWKDLLLQLQKMDPNRLEDTVTIYTKLLDKFEGCTGFNISKDKDAASGVLDHGHLYLETL